MFINNVELANLDVGDAEIMERYENAIDKVSSAMSAMQTNGKRRSELIREQCTAVFECFNEIFGEGTDKKVFGEKTNLTVCINAFEQLIKAVNKADADLANQIKSQYSPNRQQRRNNGKHKKHYNNRPQIVAEIQK